MRVCEECGTTIPEEYAPGTSQKFCRDCTRRHKREAARRRSAEIRARRELEQLVKPVKTIAEIQREAAARGMSYGQYVASLRR